MEIGQWSLIMYMVGYDSVCIEIENITSKFKVITFNLETIIYLIVIVYNKFK